MTKAKKLNWKKDNLKHVFDHGLSVVFADPQKAEFIRSLIGKDGRTVLECGKSWLRLETVGRVTRCLFFDAVGNGHYSHSIHYLSPSEGLRYSLRRQFQTTPLELAQQCSEFSNFGNYHGHNGQPVKSLPRDLRPSNGAEADFLRAWLGHREDTSWSLLGEAGLRAKAISLREALAQQSVLYAKQGLDKLKKEIEKAKQWDPVAERTQAHKNARYKLGSLRVQLEKLDEKFELAREYLSDPEKVAKVFTPVPRHEIHHNPVGEELKQALLSFGVYSSWVGDGQLYVHSLKFPAVSANFSVPYVSPNYTVKRDATGATLKLSSGLVCPFSESDALAWLRGEKPAPQTPYGLPSKVETCDLGGNPKVLIRCGCHVVDVVRDLGCPYDTLLKPTHESRLISGTPELSLSLETREEFLRRVEAQHLELKDSARKSRLRAVEEYRTEIARIAAKDSKQAQTLEGMETNLAQSVAQAEQAEKALKELRESSLGVTLSDCKHVVFSLINSFLPNKL